MARKPKVQGAASPPPGSASIKIIKDRVGDGVAGVHDGLGGKHYVGDVVELPQEVADAFIAKGFAVFADVGDFAAAKERAEALDADRRQAMNKAAATARQRGFDDAPPEIRALAREHGDDVIALWEAGESVEEIIKAYAR